MWGPAANLTGTRLGFLETGSLGASEYPEDEDEFGGCKAKRCCSALPLPHHAPQAGSRT